MSVGSLKKGGMWHVDLLLGNDLGRSGYNTTVTKHVCTATIKKSNGALVTLNCDNIYIVWDMFQRIWREPYCIHETITRM